ncbi:MAG: hypothetical protein JXR49_09575 [Acidobacteria bacterium]|nr:hypothetical protein [Acidobacteriota bacterium]
MINSTKAFLLLLVAIILLPFAGQTSPSGSASPEVAPYVRYLEGVKQTSVEYVMSLFDTYDTVILCERNHKEMTQYDFILDLLRHPKFIERVGHVYTEIGSKSQEKKIEKLLRAKNLSSKEVDEQVLEIYRNLSWQVCWEKTNYSVLLKGVYRLNQTLDDGKRVFIHPCDISFDWEKGTAVSYKAFDETTVARRDYYIAQNVLATMEENEKTDRNRKKSLVIMNYRHAYNRDCSTGREEMENVGRFLFSAFKDKIANVLINPMNRNEGLNRVVATQDGKWDAAFEILKKWDAGFSFAGSPFGGDHFDHWQFPNPWTYQDVFTGFVYYLPAERHKLVTGLPGILSKEYRNELRRRLEIVGVPDVEKILPLAEKEMGVHSETSYKDLNSATDSIHQWIK